MSETNGDIVAFFARMEDKIEALTQSVNEYKTTTAVIQSQHSEKIVQAEEKIKQLFTFHNESAHDRSVLNELIKSNRHGINNLENMVNHHENTLEKSQKKNEQSLESLQRSINDLSTKLDENDKADLAIRNQQIGKGQWLKAFVAGIGAMAGLASVVALIWTIYKG